MDGITWQWSFPNRESFPFPIPGKKPLSRLPALGSQSHERRCFCGLCATKAKANGEKYANTLYWTFSCIPLNAKIHCADTQCLAVFSSHIHCYRFLPVSSVCTSSQPFVPLFSLLFPSPYSFLPNLFLFIYDLIYVWSGPILCEVPGTQVFRLQTDHFR